MVASRRFLVSRGLVCKSDKIVTNDDTALFTDTYTAGYYQHGVK